MIDRAEVTNPDAKYSYSEDPTISGVEPSWTILKYWTPPPVLRHQPVTWSLEPDHVSVPLRVCVCVSTVAAR